MRPANVYGQPPAKALTDESLSDSERREETLKWLDKFLADSVLMTPDDVAKIRDAVAGMTPSQLERWLIQTKKLRDYVESPVWQETKRWLREFLRVQAIYSDEEIEKLREEIFKADANQMLAILERIQTKHESMTSMYKASQQMRKIDLAGRDKSMAQQAATNRAAEAASSRSSALFGNASSAGGGRMPSQKGGYQIPGPLIGSRGVGWRLGRGSLVVLWQRKKIVSTKSPRTRSLSRCRQKSDQFTPLTSH